ncbi:MAG: hypothetical protein LBD74_05650 [Spirochaetaceae bacterium]|jgi:fibronectin type 3 domain-containing protein|nr:hypothetical protein [Spirochaetaceae bacterium]
MIPEITIEWDTVQGAKSYKVYRSSSVSGSYTQRGSATTSTSYADTDPLTGDNYYKVKAVNSAGDSAFSSYASATYDPYAAAPVIKSKSGSKSGDALKLTWSFASGVGIGKPKRKIPGNDNTWLRV